MSIELSTLVFKVDTAQLTEAITKTKELAAVQKNMATASVSTTGGQRANSEGKKQVDLLTKLKDMYGDLADGATRWEASQLRAARKLGVPLAEVEKTLKDIKSLSPLTSFDSSIGAVRKMQAEFDSLQNRVELTKQGITATKTELEAFGRIPFQVAGSMQKRGANPEQNASEFGMRVESSKQQFIDKAKDVSVLRIAEKERLDVVKQRASAEKFLAAEMQRVDSVLGEMNSTYGINVKTQQRSAEMVATYANNLKRAGVEGQRAAILMEDYRKKISQIADVDKKRAGERLSNALAPQISDVAVSIAGGMPLHLVAMQQGLQIRDLIGQSKIDAKDLDEVFRKSMSNMVTSIYGTIKALSSLAYNGLKDAGTAVSDFALKWSGVGWILDGVVKKFPATAGGISFLAGTLGVLAGGALAIATGAIVGLIVEYVKLIKANDELTRSLAVTGGVFGVTKSQSASYVEGLTKVGLTTRDAIAVLGQMSDAGKLSVSQIDLIGKAASDMERYAGVAISETVKAFNEMGKDPVKALTELAIKTGDVSPKTLQLVYDLQEQGKMADAAAIAIEALAGQMSAATRRMQDDLHPLTKMLIDFKHVLSETWTSIGNTINKAMGVGSEVGKTKDRIEQLRGIQSREGSSVFNNFGAQEVVKEELASLQRKLILLDKVSQTEIDLQKTNSERAERIKKNEDNESKYLTDKQKVTRDLIKLEEAYSLAKKVSSESGKPSKISDEMYLEERKKLGEKLIEKEKKAPADKQKAYEVRVQEQLNDAYNKMVASAQQLSEIEKKILDIRDDPQYKGASQKERAAIDKMIAEKSKLIEISKDVERTLKEESDVRATVAANEKKAYADIAELYRESTVHGEKYEKTLLAINYLRTQGLVTSEKELEALRAINLARNSDADKYFKKEQEDNKKTGQGLDFAEEDMRLKIAEISGTDKQNQLARNAFETKKSLASAYNEFYLKRTEILTKTEGQAQQTLLDANIAQHERKKALIIGESELKKTLLSEEVQRQKNFDDVAKRGFESMGDALIDFAVTGKSSFGDMIKQMLIDLAKLEMRIQMMKLYEGFKGGGGSNWLGGSGIVDAMGDDFGGGGSGGFLSTLGSFFGGFFAEGGEPPMGKMSIVGEKGPELFVPKQQGTIVPNNQLGGTKKTVNVSNSYNIQIDSRSDQASIYAGVQSMLKQNNAQLVDQLQTGGHLS